jgi:hypothetical protein
MRHPLKENSKETQEEKQRVREKERERERENHCTSKGAKIIAQCTEKSQVKTGSKAS